MSHSLPKHMPALDGLRGVAILMVLMVHTVGGWRSALCNSMDTADVPAMQGLPGWLWSISLQGSNGVQLFFLVSAFTLVAAAGRRQDGFENYALRRVARVGPGFWLAGLAYSMAAGAGPRQGAPSGTGPLDWLIAAMFGQAWQGGAAMAVVPGGWSVSCEVAFYCALPVVTLAIRACPWRAVALTAAALIAAQLWARHLIAADAWTWEAYEHPLEQAPVFLLGILAATMAARVRVPPLPWVALALLAAGVGVLPLLPIPSWHLLPHLAFALVVAPVVALAAVHPPRLLAHPTLRRVGEVSYSIYLVHFAVLSASLRVAEWAAPGDDWRTLALHFGLTASASFGVACVTYRWVEQPCVRWAGWLIQGRNHQRLMTGTPLTASGT